MGGQPDQGNPGTDPHWEWTQEIGDWVPSLAPPPTVPSVARMYDYYLGGKDNFAVDRAAAEQVMQTIPFARELALANRRFLQRAVRYMAAAGVRQFLDLGTGIPTSPNVHEVARETYPDARVVYIDNDPVVIAHNRARRATHPGVITVLHDLRQPNAVLDDPEVRRVLDFRQPIGMLCIAVLPFVEHGLSVGVLDGYRRALALDSYLAISTVCSDGMTANDINRLQAAYAKSTAPLVLRTASQVEQLFEGFDLVEPGLVDVTQWQTDGQPYWIRGLCGVGRRL